MEESRHADWARQRVEESRVSSELGGRSTRQRTRNEGILFCPICKEGHNEYSHTTEQLFRLSETAVSTRQFQDHVPSQKHTRGFWRARFKTQRLILAFFFKLEILKRIQALPATSANENSPQKWHHLSVGMNSVTRLVTAKPNAVVSVDTRNDSGTVMNTLQRHHLLSIVMNAWSRFKVDM